jgi:GNAT superfamily N-acetyltransferase
MQVIIRRARSSDVAAIAELYLRARRAGSAAGTIPPPVHSDHETRRWVVVVVPRLECRLAERASGAPVGMLVLDGEWIDHMYADPEVTRRGVGAELIGAAKRERPDGLRLWTFVPNVGAQRFYRRHGFKEVERTDGSRAGGSSTATEAWFMPSVRGPCVCAQKVALYEDVVTRIGLSRNGVV